MIEELIIQYLSSRLSVPVFGEIPPSPPQRFVVVEKTGGGAENRISSAMLIVQSYGTSMLDVIQLNEEVKQAMEGAEELAEIVRCSLNSDYNFPATNIKRRRYQAVFDIIHY